MTEAIRSSLSITISVWRALLLREALSRISGGRMPWLWLLLEPMLHLAFLTFMMAVLRQRVIGGINVVIWVLVGVLGFLFFRRTASQTVNAVDANSALFVYRQVRPVDTVLVRGFLECALLVLISLITFCCTALFGFDVLPSDPVFVLVAVFGLWLFGLGVGLMFSVIIELIPEVDHFYKLAMMPLYFVSGVIFPIAAVPFPYRDWLLLNPLVHGLEAIRLGFSPYYHAIPELDVEYLYIVSICCVFLGLALHQRFAQRLVAK